MAVTTSTLTHSSDADPGVNGADWVFTASKSDTNYLTDPVVTDKEVVSKAIMLDIATEAVKVEFLNGRTYTFPAGMLAAGVMHPMRIKKVFSTGTGATVNVGIVL